MAVVAVGADRLGGDGEPPVGPAVRLLPGLPTATAASHLDQAMTAHQQALHLAEVVHSPLDEAQALAGLGRCALARGQRNQGTTQLREALDILQQISAGEAAEVAAELAALT
jgi:hypothetical protein